jgi:hypothetical protein
MFAPHESTVHAIMSSQSVAEVQWPDEPAMQPIVALHTGVGAVQSESTVVWLHVCIDPHASTVHAIMSSQSAAALQLITDVQPVPETQCCPDGHIESIAVCMQMFPTAHWSMVHAV